MSIVNKITFSLILLAFMALGTVSVYAQPLTDATYIEQIDQNVDGKNRRLNTTTSIGILILLVVVLSVSIYAYQRYVKNLKKEKAIQKEGIQKEG